VQSRGCKPRQAGNGAPVADLGCAAASPDPDQFARIRGFMRLKLIATSIVASVGLAVICVAQNDQSVVKVWGRAFDPNGAVIPRVSVTLRNQSTQETLRTVSSDEGRYTFDAVRPGMYELSAEMPYFEKLAKNISIETQQESQFDVTLELHQCPDPVKRLTGEEKKTAPLCVAHHQQLKVGIVPIEYGLIVVPDDDPSKLFPNSQVIYYGGCVGDCYEKAEVLFCPICRELESKWRKEHNGNR